MREASCPPSPPERSFRGEAAPVDPPSRTKGTPPVIEAQGELFMPVRELRPSQAVEAVDVADGGRARSSRTDRPSARARVAGAIVPAMPARAAEYPEFRYMGSKHRLLPWIHGVLSELPFETAHDPFVGAGSVAYLLKTMGKAVVATDFLTFPSVVASALIENQSEHLDPDDVARLLQRPRRRRTFIQRTFSGIFFTPDDLRFLDDAWSNLGAIDSPHRRSLALTALIRACMKRQPRGVFTVGNHADGSTRYDDGRRDVRLSLREHFTEQVDVLNAVVFDNGRENRAARADVFDDSAHVEVPDLVYLDPPYVPRADDNCYVKRYHFLEGLATYWEGVEILATSKVRKLRKPFTPFGYRRTAVEAFDRLFTRFRDSTIVLSYSENGYPDRSVLEEMLRRQKRRVEVFERPHRYHFGTHKRVARATTTEYLLVAFDP